MYRLIALLTATMLSTQAHAVVVNGIVNTGAPGAVFDILDPAVDGPFTVGINNFDSPNLFAFNEQQGVTVTSDIQVDIGTTIAAGQQIDSHYVFFDPLTTTRQQGIVSFSGPILGVATSKATLAASDGLQNPAVTYLLANLRGIEGSDSVAISGNNLFVDWRASTPGDYVRVFTAAGSITLIPLPASMILLLSGLGVLGALGRRRA